MPKLTALSKNRHTGPSCTRREMLAVSGMSLAAALGVGASDFVNSNKSKTPNVIVFLADSLRADHLGCYGYSKATSPRIDEMAESSLLFEHCYSQCCWTKPSISSLFSGYVPRVHQAVLSNWDASILDNWSPDKAENHKVQVLRDNFDLLAEAFQGIGSQTALFQTNPHCQEQFGFTRGFDFYRYVLAQDPRGQVNEVLHWLRRQPEKPFFLFVHEMDPHGPYIPEPSFYKELTGRFPDDVQAKLSEEDLDILNGLKTRYWPDTPRFDMRRLRELSAQAHEHLVNLYDAEIRGVDYHFGRLLDCLASSGLEDNTIVAFISDHGEAFGEHGLFTHNNSLFEEELHVPLIIRMANAGAGARVPWDVSLFDLFPTLATLVGAGSAEGMQAKSLLTADGKVLPDDQRPVCSYFDRNQPDTSAWLFSVIQDGYKVIDYAEIRDPEIYDRENDKADQNNLYGKIGNSETLVANARALRKEHSVLAEKFGPPEYAGMDTETMEGLRALGYI